MNNNYNMDAIDRADDFFIRNKYVFKKLSTITGILLALLVLLLIVIGISLNSVRPNSQTVSVYVESTKGARLENEVYVIYKGNRYKLINVQDSELFKYKASCETGKPVEVILGEDGNLYSNIDGLKNNTPAGRSYFTVLTFVFVTILIFIIFISCQIEAKKHEKQAYEVM